MNNVFIYFHNDMDGRVAGALCYYYETRHNNIDVERIKLREVDYTEIFNDSITSGDKVYFVDYSFSKKENINFLKNLLENGTDVVWIDHHKTSMEIVDDIKNHSNFYSKINTNFCATYLVYEYLYTLINYELPKYIPDLIEYVDSYDCWKFTKVSTHEFHYGFRYKNISVVDLFEKVKKVRFKPVEVDIFIPYNRKTDPTKTFVSSCISVGEIIKTFIDFNYNNECNYGGFEFKINYKGRQYNCYGLNIHGASQVFGDRIHDYDIVSPFIFTGNQFKYSMFTEKDDVDCSEIVKLLDVDNLGAGGHAKAAGFQTKNLIFKANCTITIKKCMNGRFKAIIK